MLFPYIEYFAFLQAEACEAGLEPQVLQEWLREFDGREEDTLIDLLHKEVQKWTHNCVDVDALQRRVTRAEETCRILSKKVSLLQMQLEKRNDCKNLEERDKSAPVILIAAKSPKVSSNAEDEGISSSERSSSPEDTKHQVRTNRQKASPAQSNNDQETTIDDVIEELRIIVKDAEEEFSDKAQELKRRTSNDQETVHNEQELDKNRLYRSNSKISLNNSESYMYEKVSKRDQYANLKMLKMNTGSNAFQNQMKGEQVTYFGNDQDYSTDSDGTKKLNCPNGPRKTSKSSMEGSVKIVVKGPDVEEAIVPAILHPQPPRRAPPCLSVIMAARHCDFTDHAEMYNSHDEEIEEETLGDGSDSLLSASKIKYNSKHQIYDGQISSVNEDHLQKQAKSDTILISPNHIDVKLRKSLDDLRHFGTNDAKDRKTLRSYEISKSKIMDVRPINRQVDVYRQFDSIPKGFETSSGRSADQRTIHRHNSKYRSEIEKRKYLRRSASHDYLESNVSSPQSRRSGSRVECRIRKFESLNSFDEHRSLQNYGRSNDSENLGKQEQASPLIDSSRFKMRRSESFHHISHHVSKRDQCSSKGESDSGLFYITDFNLKPVVTRRPRSIDAPKSPSLITKSLDRIDEGLDSMVDIVITQEQNHWNGDKRQSKTAKPRDDKQLTRSRSVRPDDFCGNFSEFDQQEKRDNLVSRNRLKNDELYHVNNKQLKSDEFYEEQRTREWNYHNELNCARSKDKTSSEDSPIILSKNGMRHNSFCQKDKVSNKFSGRPNESAIFAGRTYDTFGLGKSRFNAGKYSGNQQIKENPIGRRNTTSSLIGKRGKVTDVVSGLY